MTIEQGLVGNLITQFSSAFDCFRELVQNSIDAGSRRIDVWTSFESGDDHLGTIRIVVEDMGEGMDEAVIDGVFTKLFASGKENDRTKIGKFGIGFVSVFAMNPSAVLVHTGRAGEWWEVLFHEDRSFTKTRLDSPVEGTMVTLFIPGDHHRYREHVAGVLSSLRKWCLHARTDITFEDRSPPPGEPSTVVEVNEPFQLDADCVVSHEVGQTRVLAGYSHDARYTFINAGLTLAHTDAADAAWDPATAARLQHVSVKVESGYLEHTLSRDTVMRDGHWERVVQTVRTVVDGKLSAKLLDELEAVAASSDWTIQTMHRYSTLTSYLALEPDEVISDIVRRRVFRDVNGRAWSPEELYEAFRKDGRVLIADGPSELSRRLGTMKIPVVLGRWVRTVDSYEASPAAWSDHPLESVPGMVARCVALRSRTTFIGTVKRIFGVNLSGEVESALADPQLVYLPVAVDENTSLSAQRLVLHAGELLSAVGTGYRKLGTFVPTATSREVPFFVTGREFADVMARPPRGFEERSHLAVNREHPHFRRLLGVYESDPALAAYCLAKSLLLTEDRLLHTDLALMQAALDRSSGGA